MGWSIYELHFQVLSPLYVGYQRLGNVQRTRYYVPASVLWAALTARLIRGARHGRWPQPAGIAPGDYEAMGMRVQQQMAFSYFYPADPGRQPLYPHHEADGLRLGQTNMPWETFAWRYLNSYASTALNYDRNVAEEGTLHEVEYIAPHTRPDGNVQSHPVWLIGYVLVADDCALPWQQALQTIQIGGKRGYGWGRLRLAPKGTAQKVGDGSAMLFGGLVCQANGSRRPRIQVPRDHPLLAHTAVHGVQAIGDVEPLVARLWDVQRGAGQRVEMTDVCYAPGARLQSDRPRWFEWTTMHIWRVVD